MDWTGTRHGLPQQKASNKHPKFCGYFINFTHLTNSKLIILHTGFYPGQLRQENELAADWMTRIQFPMGNNVFLCLCIHSGSAVHSASSKWFPDLWENGSHCNMMNFTVLSSIWQNFGNIISPSLLSMSFCSGKGWLYHSSSFFFSSKPVKVLHSKWTCSLQYLAGQTFPGGMRGTGNILATLPASKSLWNAPETETRSVAGPIHRPQQAHHTAHQCRYAEITGSSSQQVWSRRHHWDCGESPLLGLFVVRQELSFVI